MKLLLILFLASTTALLAAPLPTFLVKCPTPGCPIKDKQELQAKKIQTTGSTSLTNGIMVDRIITFKCPKCGKFTATSKVFVPKAEEPIEIKPKVK